MAKKSKQLPYLNASLGDPLFRFSSPLAHAMGQIGDETRTYHFGTTFGGSAKDPYTTTCMTLLHHFREATQKNMGAPIARGLCDFMPIDGGTSRAFNMLMRYLANDVQKWNHEIAYGNKRTRQKIPLIKPVIIMPIPTYGHFLEYAQGLDGIEVVTLKRDPNMDWGVNPNHLDKLIKDLALQGKRVVAYYDSNPNNPTGHVRGKEETETLGNVLKKYSDVYEEIDRRLYAQEYNRTKRSRPTPCNHTNRIRIIDDTVYNGLEYHFAKRPYSFRQIPELREDCFVITSPSKMGLAGMRAGLIIGNDRDLYTMRMMDKLEGYCPSVMTMQLLSTIYNGDRRSRKWRESYQRKATNYYHYAGLLTKALINGIGTMLNEVDEQLADRMLSDVMRAKKCSEDDAKKILIEGINGAQVITSPQAGFFHLVDFSKFKGYRYDNGQYHAAEKARVFKNEFDISALQEKFKFAMAGGGYMGLPAEDCIRRITFAMKPADIIDMVDRIRGLCGSLRPNEHAQVVEIAIHPKITA